MLRFRYLALAVLVFLFLSDSLAQDIQQPWIRQAPPGARMLAGYFGLQNTSEQTVELVAAKSDQFGHVSMHRTVLQNGVSKMRPVERLAIQSQEMLSFEPGGLHLMLMRPQSELRDGDQVEITLCFSDGTETPVMFNVLRDAPKK